MGIFKVFKFLYTIVKLRVNRVSAHYRVIGNNFYIHNRGKIIVGRQVSLNSFPNGSVYRTALSTYYKDAIITIGENCKLNGVVIHCNRSVTIAKNCMFGPGTIICDNDSHRVVIDHNERNCEAVSASINIMENVWVGMNCIILKGVCIGENSIIAAGSLVVKDVQANCLYGGNPAKFIKKIN